MDSFASAKEKQLTSLKTTLQGGSQETRRLKALLIHEIRILYEVAQHNMMVYHPSTIIPITLYHQVDLFYEKMFCRQTDKILEDTISLRSIDFASNWVGNHPSVEAESLPEADCVPLLPRLLPRFYSEHYPENRQKLGQKSLDEAGETLSQSYVDDLREAVTTVHVADELGESTFKHPKGFEQFNIMHQAAWVAIGKACRTQHILDFRSYGLKKWDSTDLFVQESLNQDKNFGL